MSPSAPPEGAPQHPPRLARPYPLPRVRTPDQALPGPAGTEEFWAGVREHGNPLVTPDPDGEADHAAVTYLWRGAPGTRAVQVMPNKLADPRSPEAGLMEHLPGTDVWHWTVRLRDDWRGTYDLCVDDGSGPESGDPDYWRWLRGRRQSDPFNPRTLPRRWGGTPIPYTRLPAAPSAADWEPRDDIPHGTVSEHRVPSDHLGADRRVWLYRPPADPEAETGTAAGAGPEAEELPLLVLLDGEHWQPGLGVADLLDNLMADGRLPRLAAVLPESVDASTRWAELTCRPEYVGFLTRELLPWAEGVLPITVDPARTVIAGQSLGGLTAAYAAYAAPGRFGNVLAQSGSFWWPDGPDAEWLTRALADSPRLPVRFWLSFGEQEWVALPAAGRLRDTLAAAGYDDAVYREFNGGHDYLCWRTELADGLVELLSHR
ncbi:enterochelin esterase [Streptomyces tsukubensis]|uniref:Enterochelin esterase n=1 Tax=Streptomyces tsukubensis TaxID=83656 RepID=A0A1V4A8U7_9ACTN|nr:enterochelin esterase [Streptomyces tsukubensis]OON79641.1 enterochelin esterase [Streptomyces tsukubensis]QFR95827.1 enterochelin esterase [Streptomyces tsukubensis]